MSTDPYESLGEFLTAREAELLAVQFGSGQHTFAALSAINSSRREDAKKLLTSAGLGHQDAEMTVAVLRCIKGARGTHRDITPTWTMPGHEAKYGHLTAAFHSHVDAARQSIVCATYNFQKTSQMWDALREASDRAGVVVTVYVDADKADAALVKAQLPRAVVYKSAVLTDGKPVISHAKFVAIDHEVLLLTSANFSYSAENRNIEFGLLVKDSGLVESVESTMASKHGTLYELVSG